MKQVLFAMLFIWGMGTASLAAEPGPSFHCRSSDDPSCTEANGRKDAAALVARGELGLKVWGGPAAPQPAMNIILDEYNRAGISAWLTGDTLIIPGDGEDLYIKGFNETMEKAIAQKRGPGYLARVQQRMDELIKRAEAAAKARR